MEEEESTFPQTRIRAPEEGDSIIQILFGTRTAVKKCSPATIIESGALTDCDSAIEVMDATLPEGEHDRGFAEES